MVPVAPAMKEIFKTMGVRVDDWIDSGIRERLKEVEQELNLAKKTFAT